MKKTNQILRDLLYGFTDVLVCQTDEIKKCFSKKIQEHTVVIPNPIMSGLPIGSGKSGKELVTFSRITRQKNLRMMINAFEIVLKTHPDFHLSIYGDGSDKEDLIQYCDSKGLSTCVHFHPFALDIHDKVAECKIFVSTSDYEGLSNSMLEAMAMGIPCVCTDCDGGGARMIIQNKVNGILVPKNNVEECANAINYLLDNEKEWQRIRLSTLKIREELSSERICKKWLDLIK